MSILDITFYLLAAVILIATAMAITRRNLVHAVLYLVVSFFGSAMLFYLLGAPFLAALEVIIYAGAIMVLFLFIIMMIDVERSPEQRPSFRQLAPAAGVTLGYGIAGALLLAGSEDHAALLTAATATPRAFGRYLIENHWLMVEVISLLLLVALVGALYLGRLRGRAGAHDVEEG